jgi:uncharacterized SAM-binding protein YcdF (DUF218 family)
VLEKARGKSSFLPLSKKKIIMALIVIGGLALFLTRERWLSSFSNFLIIKDELKPADVIHVIAGEDYRTDYAIQLYKRDLGKTLFFTGGWCTFHQYHHGKHAEERALAQGVPANAIAYDDASVISTYMEVQRLQEWIGQRPAPVHSVIVVSDPFHMRRARWTCKKVLGERIEVQMAPVPMELTPHRLRWWTDPVSRRYVRAEYEKLIYYVLRYQISRGKLRAWLAAKDRS